MARLLLGSVVGAIAMFVVAMIFWATPLSRIGFSTLPEAQGAAVQLSLAQNVPHTGRYVVPDPTTQGGAVLFGKGPVATVDFNSGGFSPAGSAEMIGGFIHHLVVSLLIGLSLYVIGGRVVDFASRARLVVGLAAASTLMITLSDPIWMHGDWRFALYDFIADLAMLSASGLVIARWFLPARAG